MEKYDVIIIGAGVTGTAVARELSRYQIKTCVLEREEDVCCGTSKANSAIIHAGYDAEPGTLKAKLNVRGNLLIGELAEKLDFPFKRNGSLVLCLDEKDYPNLQKLYEKGITNGVKKLRILNHDEVLEMEPNVSENVYAALYAPTGGIVVRACLVGSGPPSRSRSWLHIRGAVSLLGDPCTTELAAAQSLQFDSDRSRRRAVATVLDPVPMDGGFVVRHVRVIGLSMPVAPPPRHQRGDDGFG